MKKIWFILFIYMISFQIGAESMFTDAENMLMNNQLKEAAIMFEAVVEQEPDNTKAYLYLGYIYELKQDYQSAVKILSQGLANTTAQKEQFYFNIANNNFKSGDYSSAASMYSKAMQSKSGFAEPYLNRANCRVKTAEYSLAVRDYNLYLNMKPDDPQRPNIEKMISLLELTIVEEETIRKNEEQRILTEAARQKALLDSVLNSLSNAGSDTTNLSADSAKIEDINIDLDIED